MRIVSQKGSDFRKNVKLTEIIGVYLRSLFYSWLWRVT